MGSIFSYPRGLALGLQEDLDSPALSSKSSGLHIRSVDVPTQKASVPIKGCDVLEGGRFRIDEVSGRSMEVRATDKLFSIEVVLLGDDLIRGKTAGDAMLWDWT